MWIPEKIKPKFWDHEDVAAGPRRHLFNFRRIWKLTVLLSSVVCLVPLIFMAFMDYRVTREAMESEILLRTSRLVSNTQRTISFFLAERKLALDFIIHNNTFESLNNFNNLKIILHNLKESFGQFGDLGVIDPLGNQRTYIGPYKLEGKDYSGQEWYEQVIRKGIYISDVFLGYRNVPHIVIAVKRSLSSGHFFILRASLETEKFDHLLSELEMAGKGDAFLINHDGTMQTPSRSHGKVFEKMPLPVPDYAPKTQVMEIKAPDNSLLIVGYRYLNNTPFILMVAKNKAELMEPWNTTRTQLLGFLIFSITIILMVILGGATYLVNQIYLADQRRVMSLHEVEYSNKMASIGRMAAAVAHEINNPLAIINEKAGLMKDLFTLKKQYAHDGKLLDLVDVIISSVARCASITRRLLSFARQMDANVEQVAIRDVLNDVLSFYTKEAEYRSIAVTLDVTDSVPDFPSDRGKLQQIFLNLVHNAFSAMNDGGHLNVKVRYAEHRPLIIEVADDGCGIGEEDLGRVFEPFFSTRTQKGGTGLGLPITHNLIRELGGTISVQSEVGKGTVFTITLPLETNRRLA